MRAISLTRDVLLALCVTVFTSLGAQAQGASAQDCAGLARLHLPEATVTMAEVVQPLQFKLPVSAGRGNGGPQGTGRPVGPGPDRAPRAPGGLGAPQRGGMSLAPFDPKDTNHPPFCRVAATLRPSGDSDIRIEVWLPTDGWNGKLMGAGDFGWAGSIMYDGLLLGLEHRHPSTPTGSAARWVGRWD